MASFLLPTSNAAHFHILRVFHQVKQWIGEVDNMEAKDWLLHVFARHSVQATEHSRPCFLQLQRFESQFVLHLQYIVFRSSSGAGGKLDLIGTHMLCSIDHPQSFASIFLLFVG
jgi:hypothetical protein